MPATNPLRVVHINKTPESDLAKVLMEKWKRKQQKELEEYRSGRKKKLKKY